jgi:N-acetylglutamate synthase-like GNAT family acetyltransferase
MEIVPLGNKLNFVDEIAALHHAEWKHLSPNKTIESRRATLISAAADEGFPTFYIAFKDNEFIGSAAIVARDMESRPDIGPWLAAVYVKKEWRKQGIATLLLRHCEVQASKAGIKTLYLFTESASQLYAKNDWVILEQCEYKGVNVDVMVKALAS